MELKSGGQIENSEGDEEADLSGVPLRRNMAAMMAVAILLLVSSIGLPIWSISNYEPSQVPANGHLDAFMFGMGGIGNVPYRFSENEWFQTLGEISGDLQSPLATLLLMTIVSIAFASYVVVRIGIRRIGKEIIIPRRALLLTSVVSVLTPVVFTFSWSIAMSDYLTPGVPLEFFGAAQREGLTMSYGGGIGWYLMIVASALSIAVTVIMLQVQDHRRWRRGIMLLPLGLVLLAAGFYLYGITEGAWFYRPYGWGILLAYLGTIMTTYAAIHILAFRKLRAGQMKR